MCWGLRMRPGHCCTVNGLRNRRIKCAVWWQIYDVSGLRAFRDELVGEEFRETREWLSYQLTPRAEIFRCDHGKANNLAGMQRLMRSNTFLSTDKVRPIV